MHHRLTVVHGIVPLIGLRNTNELLDEHQKDLNAYMRCCLEHFKSAHEKVAFFLQNCNVTPSNSPTMMTKLLKDLNAMVHVGIALYMTAIRTVHHFFIPE